MEVTLEGKVGQQVLVDHTSYHYFAGNNYLGLAGDHRLINSSVDAVLKYGTNFSAARQTTGTSEIHLILEKRLADFKGQEDAMVFASGYMGNKLLMDYLKKRVNVILTDSMAHASILDGIPRSIGFVESYPHMDPEALECLLQKFEGKQVLIATDGVFALTGEIAPLDEIHKLAEKYKAFILVDDAHATGVLGETGKGTPEHFGLHGSDLIFQSETMSKALGSYGGFISGSAEMIATIRNTSHFYGASTSLPPASVAAGIAALDIIEINPELHTELISKAVFVKKEIELMGFETIQSPTPIIPLFFDSEDEAKELSDYLATNRIIAPAVKYPVKLGRYLVRMTLSAAHSGEQLEFLLKTLKNWRS